MRLLVSFFFFFLFDAMVIHFPTGACKRDSRAKQSLSPLTSPLLFTMLLIRHQMVMDSHRNIYGVCVLC